MGLGVTAYSNLVQVDAVFDRLGEPIFPDTRNPVGDCLIVRSAPHFPHHAAGLSEGGVYKYFDTFHFYAGSYGRYSKWRDDLAKLVGYAPVWGAAHGFGFWSGAFQSEKGPFHDLLCFSDCEGVIGPIVGKRLLSDFQEWRRVVEREMDDYFINNYMDFINAFAFASDCGAVAFS